MAKEPFVRIPGLLRRWEIEQVLEPGMGYYVEDAGDTEDVGVRIRPQPAGLGFARGVKSDLRLYLRH